MGRQQGLIGRANKWQRTPFVTHEFVLESLLSSVS